jgi:hypothetical protein
VTYRRDQLPFTCSAYHLVWPHTFTYKYPVYPLIVYLH